MGLRAIVFCLVLWPGAALSERPVQIDLDALIALVSEPWRDGDAFADALSELLPGFELVSTHVPDTVHDPFAWRRDGVFAAVPEVFSVGANVFCTRMGVATRDVLSARNLSDREIFELFSLYQVANDLWEVWPDNAVAHVSCRVSWNDTRAVSILPRMSAQRSLAASFSVLLDTMPQGQAAYFGEDGYRLTARGGQMDSVMTLHEAEVVLTTGHQTVRVRSFLMNGGM